MANWFSAWNGYKRICSFWSCCRDGYTPQQALGAVLVAGVLFLLISLTPIELGIKFIPRSLKLGIGA